MESSRNIYLAEDFGLLDVVAKLVDVGEHVGVLDGQLIEFPEVPTGPLRAVRLVLKMERGAIVVGFTWVHSFYYT